MHNADKEGQVDIGPNCLAAHVSPIGASSTIGLALLRGKYASIAACIRVLGAPACRCRSILLAGARPSITMEEGLLHQPSQYT